MNHRSYTCHDNIMFDVATDGEDGLREVINLAYKVTGHSKAKGCVVSNVDGIQTLIFLWAIDGLYISKLSKFPTPLDGEASTIIAAQWLEQQEMDDRPNHYGNNVKGFRIFAWEWGHIRGTHWPTIIGVAPYRLMLRKRE